MRRRRTADEAREEILAAADTLLREEGVGGVRLQAVADRVGMSHPGVLHHFGSRQRLLAALYGQRTREIREDAVRTLGAPGHGLAEVMAGLVERLADRRLTQLLAQLLVTEERVVAPMDRAPDLREVAERVHALRGDGADEEDTLHGILLGMMAIFGDALVGRELRKRMGLETTPEAVARSRRWAIRMLMRELQLPGG